MPSRIRNLIKSWFSFLNTFTPSNSDMDDLLTKTEKVLGQLAGKIDVYNYWKAKLAEPKVDMSTNPDPKDKIPMKDGKVDKETWEKKPKEEKRKLWGSMDTAFKELRSSNRNRLICGGVCFVIFLLLLVIIVCIYQDLHTGWLGSWGLGHKLRPKLTMILTPKETTEIWEQVRTVELKLGEVIAKKEKVKVSDLRSELAKLKALLKQLENKTYSLSFETSRLLGAFSAEIGGNDPDPAAHQTYQEFSKKVRADLESFSTAYFWTTSPWRWYELFFWALFGCLVGLLFYIAGLLGQGVFNTEEVSMFWAELFISPIVVLVVFFLFAFTGVTNFAPSEASLTVNIGFAFILGFAVRRTIGLLDVLKKRIFPDPSPGSSSPGG